MNTNSSFVTMQNMVNLGKNLASYLLDNDVNLMFEKNENRFKSVHDQQPNLNESTMDEWILHAYYLHRIRNTTMNTKYFDNKNEVLIDGIEDKNKMMNMRERRRHQGNCKHCRESIKESTSRDTDNSFKEKNSSDFKQAKVAPVLKSRVSISERSYEDFGDLNHARKAGILPELIPTTTPSHSPVRRRNIIMNDKPTNFFEQPPFFEQSEQTPIPTTDMKREIQRSIASVVFTMPSFTSSSNSKCDKSASLVKGKQEIIMGDNLRDYCKAAKVVMVEFRSVGVDGSFDAIRGSNYSVTPDYFVKETLPAGEDTCEGDSKNDKNKKRKESIQDGEHERACQQPLCSKCNGDLAAEWLYQQEQYTKPFAQYSSMNRSTSISFLLQTLLFTNNYPLSLFKHVSTSTLDVSIETSTSIIRLLTTGIEKSLHLSKDVVFSPLLDCIFLVPRNMIEHFGSTNEAGINDATNLMNDKQHTSHADLLKQHFSYINNNNNVSISVIRNEQEIVQEGTCCDINGMDELHSYSSGVTGNYDKIFDIVGTISTNRSDNTRTNIDSITIADSIDSIGKGNLVGFASGTKIGTDSNIKPFSAGCSGSSSRQSTYTTSKGSAKNSFFEKIGVLSRGNSCGTTRGSHRDNKQHSNIMSEKMFRKLSKVDSSLSKIIAYSEREDEILTQQTKNRVQRMMHYHVSLRPFVATVMAPKSPSPTVVSPIVPSYSGSSVQFNSGGGTSSPTFKNCDFPNALPMESLFQRENYSRQNSLTLEERRNYCVDMNSANIPYNQQLQQAKPLENRERLKVAFNSANAPSSLLSSPQSVSSSNSPFMCTPKSFPSTPNSRYQVMAKGSSFAQDVVFFARDQLRVEGSLASSNIHTRSMARALRESQRLAVFSAEDAGSAIALTCGQHCATKVVGNVLYYSIRSMVPILRNACVYFEMTVNRAALCEPDASPGMIDGTAPEIHNFQMASLSVGLSTLEMPLNTLVGAWKSSVGLHTTGQILAGGVWCSPLDPRYSSYGNGCTVGCLVRLDDESAFETWDGVMVKASVTFNVNGVLITPPLAYSANDESAMDKEGRITPPPSSAAALPLFVPREEELFPTLTLLSPATQVMCRFCAEDIVATKKNLIGAPYGATVYAVDGTVLFNRNENESLSPPSHNLTDTVTQSNGYY